MSRYIHIGVHIYFFSFYSQSFSLTQMQVCHYLSVNLVSILHSYVFNSHTDKQLRYLSSLSSEDILNILIGFKLHGFDFRNAKDH